MPGGLTGTQCVDTFALDGFTTDRGDQLCRSVSPSEPPEYSIDAGKVEVSFLRSVMVAVQLGIHTKLEIHMYRMWGL